MQEEIVINVQFDTKVVEDAKTKLAASVGAVNDLKKAQSELTKTIKEQGYATREQATQLARIQKDLEAETRAQKSNTAVIQAATLAQYDSNASLDDQRQYLNTLQKAVSSMTKEQMEMVGGQKALQEQIAKVSKAVKDQEMAIGDARRNVGNYADSILDAQKRSGELAEAFKVSAVASTGLGKATDSVDKAMKLAAKNPWMAVLSLLLPIIQKLFQGLSKNEAVMQKVHEMIERLKNAFKQLEPIVKTIANLYTKVLAKAFEVVMDVIKNILKGIDWLAKKLGFDLNLAGAFEEMSVGAEQAADSVEESSERIVNATNAAVNAQLEAEKKLAEQRERMHLRRLDEWQRELEALQKARDEELAIEGLTMEERLEIEQYYADEMARIMEEQAAKMQEESAALGFGDEEEEEEEIPTPEELARKKFGLDQEAVDLYIDLIKQGMSAEEAAAQTTQTLWEKRAKGMTQVLKNIGGGFTALSDILGNYAEENKDAANAQKAFALTGIITNQAASIAEGALALAEGIRTATSIGFPQNIPAIITITATIAGLLAGIATTITQAKQVFAESDSVKFATGGIVPGTSYTGDQVAARLNSGEMVLNQSQQARLFDALNGGDSGSLGINYELMAAAMANTPAPVVAYTELQEFGQKVATYNEIASI